MTDRVSRLTSSCAQVIMTGGYAAWESLAHQLRNPHPWSDVPHPNMPPPLRWGLEHEPRARALFWDSHPEVEIVEKAFLTLHDETSWLYPHVGTSPDIACYDSLGTLVTGAEIKCPYRIEKFAEKLEAQRPAADKAQVQWHLWISGAPFWFYVLFDPRSGSYHEIVWERDQPYIEAMEAKAGRFLEGFLSEQQEATG